MPFLNHLVAPPEMALFLLILISWLSLLGVGEVAIATALYGIATLRAATEWRQGRIMPAGSLAWVPRGIIRLESSSGFSANRSRYWKLPILSLPVGLDRRNREIEKEKRKPKDGK